MKKSSFLGRCFKHSFQAPWKPEQYSYVYFGYCFCFDLDQNEIILYYNASKRPNLKGKWKDIPYTSMGWKSFMQNRKSNIKEFWEEVKIEILLTHKDKHIRDWAKEIVRFST